MKKSNTEIQKITWNYTFCQNKRTDWFQKKKLRNFIKDRANRSLLSVWFIAIGKRCSREALSSQNIPNYPNRRSTDPDFDVKNIGRNYIEINDNNWSLFFY